MGEPIARAACALGEERPQACECAECDERSVWVHSRVANDRSGRLCLKIDALGGYNFCAHCREG